MLEQPGTFVRAIGFLDAQRGFAGNLGPDSFPGVTDTTPLYRTDDGGTSWNPVALPDTDGARGVCAIDILSVDAVNAGHRLHKELVHVGGRVGGPASLFRSRRRRHDLERLTLPRRGRDDPRRALPRRVDRLRVRRQRSRRREVATA